MLSKQEEKKLRNEIKKLAKMRDNKETGFFKKLSLNKAISDRSKLLKQDLKILQAREGSEMDRIKIQRAKEKAELQELRRKSLITEEDIFGKKDLFKLP